MILDSLDLKKLGDRLRKVDRFILDVLGIRLASGGLSDYIAENKRKSSLNGIFDKRRQTIENDRIKKHEKMGERNWY